MTDVELLGGLTRPNIRPLNLDEYLARSRRFIAGWLLILLTGLVVLPWVVLLVRSGSFDEVRELMTLMFTPIIGLVGAAIGFYFGERAGEKAVAAVSASSSPESSGTNSRTSA